MPQDQSDADKPGIVTHVGRGLGCLGLLLLGFAAVLLGYVAGERIYAAMLGNAEPVRLVAAFAAGGAVVWLIDRIAKRMFGISPIRLIGELPPFP